MVQRNPRPRFKISVFLSYPKPRIAEQEQFIDRMCGYLDDNGFAPRTLGVTDYDVDAPLKAIRRLLLESNGLITVAFRRTLVEKGTENHGATVQGRQQHSLDGRWLTSPWAHIEPAMAYQLGLPILLFREQGVIEDGMLEKGVIGVYMPVFDVTSSLDQYFSSPEWKDLMRKWEIQVRSVVDRKGNPPQLF